MGLLRRAGSLICACTAIAASLTGCKPPLETRTATIAGPPFTLEDADDEIWFDLRACGQNQDPMYFVFTVGLEWTPTEGVPNPAVLEVTLSETDDPKAYDEEDTSANGTLEVLNSTHEGCTTPMVLHVRRADSLADALGPVDVVWSFTAAGRYDPRGFKGDTIDVFID
jgi:hypothetical protein